MPLDHEVRRKEIAAVAIKVIAGEGLEAATVRRIAAEVGCSTTVVTHYFPDKDELLISTFLALADQGRRKLEEALARDPGDIVGALMASIPAHEDGRRRWRVYVAFWDRAVSNPRFAEAQRSIISRTTDRFREMVSARIGEPANMDRVVQALTTLLYGLSVQALVDQASWPASRIRSVLIEQVELLIGEPRRESDLRGPTPPA